MDQPIETAADRIRPDLEGARALLAVSALLFIASAVGTFYWCGSMTGGMEMPGGWTMSMAWMRMPGQTWPGAAAMFMGMWVVMMVAMMLPSLTPVLVSYRRCLHESGETHLASKTTLAAAGYFIPWTAFGAVAYPLGLVVAAAEMRWATLAQSVPVAASVAIVLAGCFELTKWKARHLGCCRVAPGCGPAHGGDASGALAYGVRLGVHCILCCCGFMMILFAAGVMSPPAMAIVALAITIERIVPWPALAARATGCVILAAGIFLIIRATMPI